MNCFEIIDPRFAALVLLNAPLEILGTGFRWLEGPVWFADHDCLLVSDVPNNRVMRWSESGGWSVFRQPSAFANGHARDREGRLITCSHLDRCVYRTELDGNITRLVHCYQGKRLNSPNDVVVKSDGTIWFSDPLYGISNDYEGSRSDAELAPSVYRFDPRDAQLAVVADDFAGPNGLCFSPDERYLYVAETGAVSVTDPPRHIRRFRVGVDGNSLKDALTICSVTPGYTDGLCCDEDGNLWSSAGDGVHCLAPDGTLLGKIRVPFVVSNVAFGDRHRSRLFICASHTLYAIFLRCRGVSTLRGADDLSNQQ